MKTFGVYLRPGAEPVLLAGGFSFAALLFGPLWLLGQRAWIAALVLLCLQILLVLLMPAALLLPALLALAWLVGITGRDLAGWALERRGYDLAHVVAARDEDAAFARLMAARPDLADHIPAGLPAW